MDCIQIIEQRKTCKYCGNLRINCKCTAKDKKIYEKLNISLEIIKRFKILLRHKDFQENSIHLITYTTFSTNNMRKPNGLLKNALSALKSLNIDPYYINEISKDDLVKKS